MNNPLDKNALVDKAEHEFPQKTDDSIEIGGNSSRSYRTNPRPTGIERAKSFMKLFLLAIAFGLCGMMTFQHVHNKYENWVEERVSWNPINCHKSTSRHNSGGKPIDKIEFCDAQGFYSHNGIYYEKRTYSSMITILLHHILVNPEDPEDTRYPIVNYIIYTISIFAIIIAMFLLFACVEKLNTNSRK
jgi:hypothetical protein